MMYVTYMCDAAYPTNQSKGNVTFEGERSPTFLAFLLSVIDAGRAYYGSASPSESYMLVGLTAEDFD